MWSQKFANNIIYVYLGPKPEKLLIMALAIKMFIVDICENIREFIDYVHKPFRKYISLEPFRYLICGGANTVLDILLYFVLYNFIIQKRYIYLGFLKVSPHIFTFLIVFPITFFTGFLLSKYITFSESELRGKKQLVRFGITIVTSLVLQYGLLKFFVDLCHLYPTPSKIITSGLVAVFSFFSHQYFSFVTRNFLPEK
jgi:putative flippase GtrA